MVRIYFIVALLSCIIFISASQDQDDVNAASELPQKSDLMLYLKSLHRIVKFCERNKYDLDLNFAFGLFIANVNLKQGLKNLRNQLPKQAFNYISTVLDVNDSLLKFFDYMVTYRTDNREKLNKKIISLFLNEAKWMSRLQGFDTNLIEPSDIRSRSILEDKGVEMSSYILSVDDMDRWVPQPSLSDLCMISLANRRDHDSNNFPRCHVYDPCYNMLLNGTNFGYALSHRLLFLINAKHSRGCSVFSKWQDAVLKDRLCEIAYDETKYIANNGYEIIDLVLEFISLCGIDGNAQFLRKDWLLNSLRFQTPYGCFGVLPPNYAKMKQTSVPKPSRTWKVAKNKDHQILGGLCNGHVTSVAAAALSTAVRYILETYY